jgi:hypothetical protein
VLEGETQQDSPRKGETERVSGIERDVDLSILIYSIFHLHRSSACYNS